MVEVLKTGEGAKIMFTVEDECRMELKDPEGQAGWVGEIPKGFSLTCPHGYTVIVGEQYD